MRNECTLTGTVTDKIHPFEDAGTHEHLKYKGENLYEVTLDIARLSGSIDRMRVVIPSSLLKEKFPERIHITGAFQSRNDSRGRLILYIMTTTLEPALTIPDENRLVLSSYICKKPVFRETPLGTKITDLLLANNQYDENREEISSYIPSICWNKDAEHAGSYHVGDWIYVSGRIQSREYDKEDSKGKVHSITVNEFSIARIIRDNSKRKRAD